MRPSGQVAPNPSEAAPRHNELLDFQNTKGTATLDRFSSRQLSDFVDWSRHGREMTMASVAVMIPQQDVGR